VADQGHVVAARYRLVRRFGEGGMGTVWVADDLTLHSQVAIKLLHSHTEDGLKRFLREAQAAARLRSPHVVQIIEHGVDGDAPFIAMELLEGESLAARLGRLSTLPLAQTARIVTHVARAIGKAHDAGIVHRDLKPDNVFIVHNDDEEMVKVLDFGIAKMEQLAESASKVSTEAGALLGTPYYMSPEQVRGQGVDSRSDLWSLALIAFECVCGRSPFEGRAVGDVLVLICSEQLPVPSTLRPLPPAFDAWFAKATARNADERFQTAKEMADALRAIVGEDTRTPDPTASGSIPRVTQDAPTLDAGRISDLESARTISVGGTMGGASSAIRKPPSGKSWRLVGGAVAVAGVLGAVAWASLSGRQAASSPSSRASAEVVPTASHSTEPVPTTTTTAAATAAASATATASATAAPTASTAAHPLPTATAKYHHPRPAHTAHPTAAPADTKNDVLTF
jgi:serine/threonine protein kinase